MSESFDKFDMERRLQLLRAVLLVTFILLGTGLAVFQLMRGDEYVRLASQNRLRILRISPPRGIIMDSQGAPLAVNVRTFNLSGYPIDLQKEENVRFVSSLLNRNGIPMDDATLRKLVERQ